MQDSDSPSCIRQMICKRMLIYFGRFHGNTVSTILRGNHVANSYFSLILSLLEYFRHCEVGIMCQSLDNETGSSRIEDRYGLGIQTLLERVSRPDVLISSRMLR